MKGALLVQLLVVSIVVISTFIKVSANKPTIILMLYIGKNKKNFFEIKN